MAISGVGTIIQIEQTAGVWTTIAEVSNIDLSGITVDTEETTSLNSGDFKEFIPTFIDAGTLNLSLLFSKSGYLIFYNSVLEKKILQYKIMIPDLVDPDGTIFLFTGIVTNLPVSVGTSEAVKISLSIKITGVFIVYVKPTISIQSFTSVTDTTATGNANLLTIGTSTILEKGFCRKSNTAGDPTISDTKLIVAGGTAGAFTGAFTGLTAETTYKVRAYVTDAQGTVYSETITLTTTV